MIASPRLSLRAQLALVAAAASLLSAVLTGVVLVPSVQRVVAQSAWKEDAAVLDVVASSVADRCASAEDRVACERLETKRLGAVAGRRVRFAVGDDPPEGPVAQVDRGPPLRWITFDGGGRSQSSPLAATVVRLGLGLAALGALLVFLFVYAALVRGVARPAERLLLATERVGSDAPLLAEEGPVLGRLGIAFDRMGARLSEERRTVDAQVAALREANRALAEARESAIRQEKLATVGRLAAGVAHEIGNPLAALLGYMQIVRGKPEAKALAAYVEPMEREAKRIDRILRDLLDFARPARASAGPAIASVPRTIERTLRLLEPQKRFHGVVVQLEVEEPLPPVRADEHQLGQVLVNLLLNASDAMGGRGAVTIGARTEGRAVVLTVRDTGPGIPPEHLPQLFDPFFTTKPPGEGTGLGLAICHSLVESFGGSVTAANAEGGGAEFRIELPIAAEPLANSAYRG